MLGLETEHALVSSEAGPRLGEELGKALLAEAIEGTPSARSEPKEGYFLANGSLIHLEIASRASRERLPLLETATAECSSPLELVTHARAAALRVGRAAARLRESGRDLSVFRSSTDLLGRTWGAHENYQVRDEHALWSRAVWFAAITVFFVFVLLLSGAWYSIRLTSMLLVPPAWRERARAFHDRAMEVLLDVLAYPVVKVIVDPAARLVAYRRVRPPLEAHLATRIIYSGAGGLALAPGEPLLLLSPRAVATSRMFGVYQFGRGKPAIDPKPYLTSPSSVLRASQRLQVGTGESNRMQVAEWLKVGTTWLLIEAIERGGHLRPVLLRHPRQALHDVSRGGHEAPVELADGRFVRAIDHQWLVLRSVRAVLGADARDGEPARLIARWASVLRRLESGGAGLERELDVHAKRRILGELARERGWTPDDLRRRCAAYGAVVRRAVARRRTELDENTLLSTLGRGARRRLRARLRAEGLSPEPRPDELAVVLAAVKIDLRYHELGRGYHDMLVAAGEVDEIVPFERIRAALLEPPAVRRPRERGRRIRMNTARPDLRVGWDATHGGGEVADALPPLD